MKKHTILFLATNPSRTEPRALDQKARAIQVELERSGFRNCFELATRWATEPLDLLRELRKLKPTIVHFSGHGGPDPAVEHQLDPASHRDLAKELGRYNDARRPGLFFQGLDSRGQFVSAQAIEQTFGAAGTLVKLVVLDACYSEAHAEALLAHVDCVVGINGSIRDDAARSFAIGFYGGLGECESVAVAYKHGVAAISLEGLHDSPGPQLRVRAGVDATRLILAAPQASQGVASPAAASSPPKAGALDARMSRLIGREILQLAPTAALKPAKPPQVSVGTQTFRIDRHLLSDSATLRNLEFLLEMVDALEQRLQFLRRQQVMPIGQVVDFSSEEKEKAMELHRYNQLLSTAIVEFVQ